MFTVAVSVMLPHTWSEVAWMVYSSFCLDFTSVNVCKMKLHLGLNSEARVVPESYENWDLLKISAEGLER